MKAETETETEIRKEITEAGYRLRSYGGDYGYYKVYDFDGNCVFKTYSICDLRDWWQWHGP